MNRRRHACAAIRHWADQQCGEARRLQHARILSDHQADTFIGLVREIEEDVLRANDPQAEHLSQIDVNKATSILIGIAEGRD